ncbi:MAG: RND transporter [Novosphingobium sp. 28-62-57]|uniref:efflux transporter outer membrane subunit n=1 Tax=unclassified Novosphingobium TaxID=2644732 RepID=UPI000BD49F92|nr:MULTISPECIES: efflux transporter outer membrane subunit [unclassified Novosphingobium]OYW51004.1 MAG: RND transporter [Novosphingobium sp. 12-62-10]OYZ11174.1 MAG: RND transporter [Novosphingobium sp. 28-62-57]OZA31299.1 MAG: RND transporter [Novosphingobium sp. 17-62-9]HQS69020.1 efflux transporter outer membrane subunit [Novosphingobium sp.]
MKLRLLLATLPALALASCNFAPKYVRPDAPVAPALPQGTAYPALGAAEAQVDAIGWRDFFTDPRLQQVIARSLADNRNLRASLANVERARALYRVNRAALFPIVNGSGTLSAVQGTQGRVTDNFLVQAGSSSYEIDLWGRLRNLTEAGFQTWLATDEGRKSTQIALVAETASAWLSYAATADALRIAQETVATRKDTLALNVRREAIGIGTKLEVATATSLLNTAETNVADLQTNLAQARNALELITGGPLPDDLLPTTLGAGDQVLGALPVGLSSEVLLRRPDVLSAEHTLRAAYANIGAARAAFLPRLSITGLFGFASPGLTRIFESGDFQKTANTQLGQRIFDGGATANNLKATKATRDAALATYERAIQVAFREVADALARRGTIDESLRAQTSLAANAATAYRLSKLRYDSGVANFLEPLDAQRTLYNAQQSLIAARLTKASNMVELYRALGGGLVEMTAAPEE